MLDQHRCCDDTSLSTEKVSGLLIKKNITNKEHQNINVYSYLVVAFNPPIFVGFSGWERGYLILEQLKNVVDECKTMKSQCRDNFLTSNAAILYRFCHSHIVTVCWANVHDVFLLPTHTPAILWSTCSQDAKYLEASTKSAVC